MPHATSFAADVALLDINHDALGAVKTHIDAQQSKHVGGYRCRVEIYTVDITNEDRVDQTVHDAHGNVKAYEDVGLSENWLVTMVSSKIS